MNDRMNIQGGGGVFRALFLALALVVPAGLGFGQSVTESWNFVVGPLTAGRLVQSVSSVNVGTDGSVAVTLNTNDGSFENNQWKLFWIAVDGTLIWDSGFIAEFPVALAIRPGLLVYQQGDTVIKSVVKPATGPAVVGTVTTAGVGNFFSGYSIEQGRTPGVLAVAEVEGDSSGFTLRAYHLTPSLAALNLVGTSSGVQGGQYILQFQTQPGTNYQIQSSTDLLTWVNEGVAVVGDGAVKSLLEAVSNVTHKFFRVVQL